MKDELTTQTEPSDSNTLIHKIIEHQAINAPNKVAVTYQNISLTYRNISEYSTNLASILQHAGVKRGTFVGVYMEYCVDLIPVILAIFKVGAIYVPLNPCHPKERIKHILDNANLSILITKKHLKHDVDGMNLKAITIDGDYSDTACPAKKPTFPTIYSNDLAYVMYTSGSTGTPKGVMVSHGNLIHAYNGWRKEYNLDDHDCHLQMANFSFDVFMGDLTRALCSGARLILCPRDTLTVPEKLYKLIKDSQINCAEFVPATLRNLVSYIQENKLSLKFMRLLICGSDTWSIREYKDFQKLCSDKTRVINSYGLTEATIDSTFFEMSKTQDNLPDGTPVPLGKPFPNTEVLLLDKNLDTVSPGSVGEIYIGGAGVATGYLNQPSLTAEKFIKSPFKSNTKTKLYKTGDLGRMLADGNIEFLGRVDSQVKLNGIRIELGEIENALMQHPGIDCCAVTVTQENTNINKLVAHIVTKNKTDISISNMQAFLINKIPKYMIPSKFIKLDSLPLNSNGKIDKKKLNKNPVSHSDELFKKPNKVDDKIEKKILSLWQKHFKSKNITTLDDFYSLGGDSLLLANIVYEIEKIFSIDFPTCQLGNDVTVKKLSQIIKRQKSLIPV